MRCSSTPSLPAPLFRKLDPISVYLFASALLLWIHKHVHEMSAIYKQNVGVDETSVHQLALL